MQKNDRAKTSPSLEPIAASQTALGNHNKLLRIFGASMIGLTALGLLMFFLRPRTEAPNTTDQTADSEIAQEIDVASSTVANSKDESTSLPSVPTSTQAEQVAVSNSTKPRADSDRTVTSLLNQPSKGDINVDVTPRQLATTDRSASTVTTRGLAVNEGDTNIDSSEVARGGISFYRKKWAIIIGIDKYNGGDPKLKQLNNAENDAREFRNLLQQDFGYSAVTGQYLVNEEATIAKLKDVFHGWLPKQDISENDSFIFFFAGHGSIDGWLAATDSQTSQEKATCLSVEWLRDEIGKLPCKHKLIILDSCYSGALFRDNPITSDRIRSSNIGQSNARGAPDQGNKSLTHDNLTVLSRAPAFLGISAGRFTPVADGEGENSHSRFTSALLEVLRQRSDTTRPDGAFTFRAAAAQIADRVTNAWGSGQIPEYGRLSNGDGDMIFAPVTLRLTPRQLARRTDYANRMNLTKRYWDDNKPDAIAEHLEATRPERTGGEELRDFEWYYWQRLLGQSQVVTITPPANADPSNYYCAVSFSRDGRRIATAHRRSERSQGTLEELRGDARIEVWDASTGKRLLNIDQDAIAKTFFDNPAVFHKAPHACWLDFDPKGEKIFCAFVNGPMRLWDASTGVKLFAINVTQGGDNSAYAISADGQKLLLAHEKQMIIFDANTGTWLRDCKARDKSIEIGGGRVSAVFSPNRKHIVTSGQFLRRGQKPEETSLRLWDAATGKDLLDFKGNATPRAAVAFNRKGDTLVSRSTSNSLVLWDASTGQPKSTITIDDSSQKGDEPFRRTLAFSPDDSHVLTGHVDGSLKSWNVITTQLTKSIKGHSRPVTFIAYSDDGRFVCSSDGSSVKLWNESVGQEPLVLDETRDQTTLYGDRLAFNAGGTRLISSGFFKGPRNVRSAAYRIWDTKTGKAVSPGGGKAPLSVAFCPVGNLHAVGDIAGEVLVFGMSANGTPINSKISLRGAVTSVAFARDGRRIVCGTDYGSVQNVDYSESRVIWKYKGRGDKQLEVEENLPPNMTIDYFQSEKHYFDGNVDGVVVAYSPTGTQIAAGDRDGFLQVLDAETGKSIHFLRVHSGQVCSVAFNNDGGRIVTGGNDNTVRVRSALTGEETLTLRGHTDTVFCVQFSPNGRRIVSGSADKTVKLWDAATGQELLTLRPDSLMRFQRGQAAPKITSVAFSPDGRRIAVGGRGTIIIWDARESVDITDDPVSANP